MFKKKENIPSIDDRLSHIAFIMDGNGRWAKKRSLPRKAGHKQGAKSFENIVRECNSLGIKTVTVYAFSTENWKRPKDEVNGIMRLIYGYLEKVEEIKEEYDTSIKFIGDKSALPKMLREKCIEIENMSVGRSHIINIALNYGGRDEIVMAVNKAIKEGRTPITAEDISRYLYTSDSPDPDLIIRTGGDMRLSNFMIWQSAYSELYVTETLWPDFGREEVIKAAEAFYKRKRRFGGLNPEDLGK